jgi:Co/Zn/Cd efflux system component
VVSLTLTSTTGWTWIDPVVALALAAIAVHEGRAASRGDDCC